MRGFFIGDVNAKGIATKNIAFARLYFDGFAVNVGYQTITPSVRA